jgi:hypothetical protein
MSLGPGRIELAIEALLRTAVAHQTFTASEIARRVYGGIETVERKHTIAVRRALINVVERNPDWRWGVRMSRDPRHRGERVLYNRWSAHGRKYGV